MELTLGIIKEWLKDNLEIEIKVDERQFETVNRINVEISLEGETITSDYFDINSDL